MKTAGFTQVAALGIVLALAVGSGAWAKGSTIKLEVGKQKVFVKKDVVRIAVMDPSIVEVKTIGNNQLLIEGLAAGKTEIAIWKDTGERTIHAVEVVAPAPREKPQEKPKEGTGNPPGQGE